LRRLQLALTASAAATDSGGGSYFYRYSLGDRRREIGLGSRDKVSLADACKAAKAWAVLRDEGHDPIETRRRERADNLAKSRAQQPITSHGESRNSRGIRHVLLHRIRNVRSSSDGRKSAGKTEKSRSSRRAVKGEPRRRGSHIAYDRSSLQISKKQIALRRGSTP
jgi:hypothetical protein